MRLLIFGTQPYERTTFLKHQDPDQHQLVFLDARLSQHTLPMVGEGDAVCVFVNDDLNAEVVEGLHQLGVRLILLRCAGFNQVDLKTAEQFGMTVARVPEYSPFAVAEHTLALMLSLNRRIHRAWLRTREFNFNLGGLMGFDFHAKTVGIVGYGRIGQCVARMMHGLGCRVLISDPVAQPDDQPYEWVGFKELIRASDVITLHCPLTPTTHHLINEAAFAAMKKGVMLINTSRGGLVDTRAAIKALKTEKLGYLGLDVYEEEADLFFQDLSDRVIPDDVFARLMTFPNVLITAHQAFFTQEAMDRIVLTTLDNLVQFRKGTVDPRNLVHGEHHA
ncbi:2-hydroxyacid dehydrogenase [Acanthopleuribacter pedis]|uniref:2-hydroxyacid dehydrogenase n=1 Tax=Acanthopleuribacter pedis TaxID=442870 RepID=A0A8J7Q2E4_9BACT|nr:2-hydroxyacid dehydrogenase [Acanthopleuribacter pedis]MBO1318030.1 2-hydroxyacid dehydrogenase [Acanthopleuribacter pedis]